ncbi:MAG: transglutaminase domain-containing protein [Candidatus Accumulibacter sp.]|nr:transglutaminase domain-containing protein [Accumulibacter sp.]
MLQRNAYGIIRAEAAPPLLDVVVARRCWPHRRTRKPPTCRCRARFAELLQRLPALAALAPGSAGTTDGSAGLVRRTLPLYPVPGRRAARRTRPRTLPAHRSCRPLRIFASATVLLLRALGIPARCHRGYSVQEVQPTRSGLRGASATRARAAEGFVDGRWVEVDTTPSTWLTVEEDAAPFWRPLADLLSFAWRRFAEWRRDVAASEFPVTTLALVAPLAALLAWLVLRRARPRRKSGGAGTGDAPEYLAGAEMRSFRALEQEFALRGFGRHLGEPPRAWLARLDREGRPFSAGRG